MFNELEHINIFHSSYLFQDVALDFAYWLILYNLSISIKKNKKMEAP